MNITDIRFRKILDDKKVKAVVSITLNDLIVIHDIKIIKGTERTFIAMPTRTDKQGTKRDTVHPINYEFRNYIEKLVLDEYNQILKQKQSIQKITEINFI